ncbi:hypothetical protein AA313_de0205642 [Arthrobotrys entomopaga]|nr:hypothetical protein AA313_de0205642 [Arthrobotrys entomopaga]
MKFQSRSSLLSLLLASPSLGYFFGNYYPPYIFGFKRDLESGEFEHHDLEDRDLFPALENANGLEKRQAGCSQCFIVPSVTYSLSTPLPYMATPYGGCTITASTSNLCPTDYYCACQTNTTSICLPTTATQAATACTPFSGPLTTGSEWNRVNTSFVYTLSSTLPIWAAPSGQCGGVAPTTASTSWNPSQTLCPTSQACACKTAGVYSACVDTTDSNFSGTDCANTCRYEFTVSLPPPSSTALMNGQCGGSCWNGPTNCPDGASCYTETSPNPGGYAECNTAHGSRLRVRNIDNADAGIRVPVQARAVATMVYF